MAHARFSVTLALCVALVAAGSAAVDLGHGGRTSLAQTESAKIVRLSDVADTYVSYAGTKTQNYGSKTRITASNAAGKQKVGYLRFTVPASLVPYVQSARLVLTRDDHHLSGAVSVSSVADASWTESSVDADSAPAVGPALGSTETSARTNSVSFDVMGAVGGKSEVSFAVTSASTTNVAQFRSRESSTGQPQLVLVVQGDGPGPSTSASSSAPDTAASSTSAGSTSASTSSSAASTTASSTSAETTSASTSIAPSTSSSSYPPEPTSALFGGTPRGASNAGGVAAMDSDYGPAKVVRLFWSGGARTSTVTDRRVVGSIKSIDSDTAAWASTMWRWTYMHEIDSKVKKGQYTLAAWRSKMDSLVALKIPGLSVILTANAFDNPSKNPSDYLVPGVTHLGVDFDGISQSGGYHDYSKELSAVVAFTKAHNLTWGVGEFGANRASNDPSGTARAAWLKDWAGKFAAAGAEYVLLWENNSQAGSNFTTPAETAAVRELLAK